MPDVNIRDFPEELYTDAKIIAVGEHISLKELVIRAVREHCNAFAEGHAQQVQAVSSKLDDQPLRETHLEPIDSY